jgi:flagellar FliJ protein
MKFKFSLEKVLRHRQILEDLSQTDYQEALAALNARQSELDEMIRKVSESRIAAENLEVQSGLGTVERVKQIHDFIKLQDIRIARKQIQIMEAKNLVEARQEILRQKAMDKKIIERLKEKKKLDHLNAERKNEQKETDEMVSMRFLNSDNKGQHE